MHASTYIYINDYNLVKNVHSQVKRFWHFYHFLKYFYELVNNMQAIHFFFVFYNFLKKKFCTWIGIIIEFLSLDLSVHVCLCVLFLLSEK